MNILVNGERKVVADGLTVAELVVSLGLGGGPVAVERNHDIVPRKEHASTRLEEGDALEIVHFVGGG